MSEVSDLSDTDLQAAYSAALQPAVNQGVQALSDADLKSAYQAVQPGPSVQQQLSSSEGWKRAAGLTARNIYSGVAALPLTVMDLGVGARNILGNAYNRIAGNPATPDYTLPSTMFQQNLTNMGLPTPQTKLERIGGAAETALAGGLMQTGPMTVTNQAPANFISPATTRQQLQSALLARAQGKGLVVPPSTTNPTWLNTTLESIAGKENIQNYARIANDEGRTAIAAEAIGLNPETITPNAVRSVMEDAGKSFEAVKAVPKFNTSGQYVDDLAKVLQEHASANESFPGAARPDVENVVNTYLQDSMTGKSGVAAVKLLRQQASDAFHRGDGELGRVYKGVSQAIENEIGRAVQDPTMGISPDVVSKWQAGRQLYAKAALVRDSMLPDGTVSGPKLAAAWRKDEPITGALRTAAEFAAQYPKANLAASASGSPVSHLAGGLGPLLGGAVAESVADRFEKEGKRNVWPFILGATAYPAARMGARSYLLGPGQAGAIPPPPSMPSQLTPQQLAALRGGLLGAQ